MYLIKPLDACNTFFITYTYDYCQMQSKYQIFYKYLLIDVTIHIYGFLIIFIYETKIN